MPQSISMDKMHYADRYKLLEINQKAAIRGQMVEFGISEPTVFRWLRERTMPPIWQEKFRQLLISYENATT
jgi:hypothetical protein